jgi:GNAT superfamily N-acetyltransferase
LIGTISVRPSHPKAQIPAYREPGTMILGQFGVDPRCWGRGIGRALHECALRLAEEQGATIVALDTASPASRLIETYRRWGYREIGVHRWEATNYESVVMATLAESNTPQSIILTFPSF